MTAKAATPRTRLADAAFRLLAKKSWSKLTLASVARSAKMPLADLHALVPSKPALIGLLLSRVGEDVARRFKPDAASENERDRVFDVSLAWFEAVNTREPALRSLYGGLRRDPLALLAVRREFVHAAEWLLALAEADTGRALPLKAAVLTTILARAIPVWLDDDKESSQTMAKLDADLRRARWVF